MFAVTIFTVCLRKFTLFSWWLLRSELSELVLVAVSRWNSELCWPCVSFQLVALSGSSSFYCICMWLFNKKCHELQWNCQIIIFHFNCCFSMHFDNFKAFFCQQMHSLLKHKMLQLTLKISLYVAPTCFGPFGPSSGSIWRNLAKVTVF
jgi:hypothetical protein